MRDLTQLMAILITYKAVIQVVGCLGFIIYELFIKETKRDRIVRRW
jgi:hypothetical protein